MAAEPATDQTGEPPRAPPTAPPRGPPPEPELPEPSPVAAPKGVADLQQEIEQLRAALITRDTIGQAKGVIRVVFQCNEDAAFSALAKLSQDTNRKVSDVALMIMDVTTSKRALSKESMGSLRRGITNYRQP